MVNLLPFFFFFESKTESAGRVPPDAILLSGNKSMQKCLYLAVGISFAGLLSPPTTADLDKQARCRGASLISVTYNGKAEKHIDRHNSPQKERLTRASVPAREA